MRVFKIINLISLLFSFQYFAQFAGAVGSSNCDAIFKDSNIILAWANSCSLSLGRENITNVTSPIVAYGFSNSATGIADNTPVTLGDGGSATLTFANGIINGSGPDFCVFENSFSNTFLELAFIEVSSNGIDFVRFPCVSNTQSLTQIGPFDNLGDATKLYNMAGKYRANYGTPFDLQELVDSAKIDVNAISHVKIIDVVGQVGGLFVSRDKNSNPINDPFPTEFATGGFDLDAVGVMHSGSATLQENETQKTFSIIEGVMYIKSNPNYTKFSILNSLGQVAFESNTLESVALNELTRGIYFLRLEGYNQFESFKFSW